MFRPGFLLHDGGSSALRGSLPAFRRCSAAACNIMSTSIWNNTRKALMTNTDMQHLPSKEAQCISQLHFGLDRMEAYYLSFKEKRSITVEAQFELESYKDDFPNIYNQIGIRDWGPFIIPIGSYFPELVGVLRLLHGATKYLESKRTSRQNAMPSVYVGVGTRSEHHRRSN
ncbi:hypothetical protein HAX54_008673 [Datura stramonium]|uniref:Uncharacterized protein n=1 Tax=Datura stramonium TaxID=4076 RepID=A0ABS8TFG0_DATST|nr:hypothetical protein [Datura stramonium]